MDPVPVKLLSELAMSSIMGSWSSSKADKLGAGEGGGRSIRIGSFSSDATGGLGAIGSSVLFLTVSPPRVPGDVAAAAEDMMEMGTGSVKK